MLTECQIQVKTKFLGGTFILDISQGYIDLLRAAHLICFAAGMGTALYLDFISFWSLPTPNRQADIRDLERIHVWVGTAFLGLWVTGLTLIYVRTSFDIAQFSPKLWLKIAVMVGMTVNSAIIVMFILPMMRGMLGRRVIDLPLARLAAITQIAIISLFCWSAGVFLGSSVVLKTAPWDVLLPLTAGWFVALTLGGHMAVLVQRARLGATPRRAML